MKILRTLLLYGPDSLGLSVIYIKAEGFSGKMLKLRLHATRPSFYREARGGGQTGVGFNQPDEEAPINVVSLQLDCFQAGQELLIYNETLWANNICSICILLNIPDFVHIFCGAHTTA